MIKHKTLNIKFIFKNIKQVENISSYQTNFYSKKNYILCFENYFQKYL